MVIKMNKKTWIIISIILIILIGGGIFFFFSNNPSNNDVNNTNNYEANRTSTNQDNSQEQNDTNNNNTSDDNPNNNNSNDNQNVNKPPVQPKEEQIATFSTKIYDKDTARQNNINITCNTLNGTVVKNGATFSFCNTVGQASTSKGYQEADILDNNGKKKKGLGGRKLSNKYHII